MHTVPQGLAVVVDDHIAVADAHMNAGHHAVVIPKHFVVLHDHFVEHVVAIQGCDTGMVAIQGYDTGMVEQQALVNDAQQLVLQQQDDVPAQLLHFVDEIADRLQKESVNKNVNKIVIR